VVFPLWATRRAGEAKPLTAPWGEAFSGSAGRGERIPSVTLYQAHMVFVRNPDAAVGQKLEWGHWLQRHREVILVS